MLHHASAGRITVLAALLVLAVTTGKSQTSMSDSPNPDPAFDSTLAARLGADEYGMRPYVLVFLYAGPNRDFSPEEATALQRGHMDNIKRLQEEGLLVFAGPFLDDGPLRGLYLFAVQTVAEAQSLTASDPAIQAGSLRMELHPWYGSAALLSVRDIHLRVARKSP
jgi:uncharacterized protein YciI